MSEPIKAVCLSYASQDADAARRICEALRAAGVEVWFDQNELVGGDAWDAKIRKQIAECALFVPIISASTQARGEGYFRIEWRLAAQRTHAMSERVAFLLPVVIDETRDAEADVPAEFKAVQWTRLPGGEKAEKICARVKKLLGGSEIGSTVGRALRPDNAVRATESGRSAPPAAGHRARWLVPALIGAVVLGALAVWRPWAGPTAPPSPAAGAPATSKKSAAPPALSLPNGLSEARQLVAKAWVQLNKPWFGRAELEVADDFCRRAAALDGTDAEVWAAWSQVDSWYVSTNLDATPARRESARTKAARALQLSAESYEARLAHACHLVRGGANDMVSLFPAEADALLRKLLQEAPGEPRALLAFGKVSANAGKLDEARTAYGLLAKQPAVAALATSELGWTEYLYAGDYRAAELAADASLVREPFYGNLILKFCVALCWRGDLALAKATLDRIPATDLQQDEGVSMSAGLHYWRRDPESMLRVLGGVSRDWLRSNDFDGPKAWWSGLAHQLAGRNEPAQLQWRTALIVVERRLAEQPDSAELLRWKGRLQAATGDLKGAETTLRLADGTSTQPSLWWWWSIRDQILLGKRDTALTLLEQVAEKRPFQMSLATCQLDPNFDALRDQPRFKALLARLAADPKMSPNATPPPSAAQPPTELASAKSVAVLPFTNLSPDPENAFFCEGMHEDVLTTLAKIRELKVISRTSTLRYRNHTKSLREVASELGAAHVLEGSVRREGKRVRINVKLIKAATDEHVWGNTIDKTLDDVFAIQSEIAQEIAKALQAAISPVERARIEKLPTQNQVAYDRYLQGRDLFNKGTKADNDRARALLREALALDPKFALAWSALADTYVLLLVSEMDPPSVARLEGRKAVERALELDPNLPEAHLSLAVIMLNFEWDWDRAEQHFRRALELNDRIALIHHQYGWLLVLRRRFEEAKVHMEKAIDLNPRDPFFVLDLSAPLRALGRRTEVRALVEKAIAIDPELGFGYAVRGMEEMHAKRWAPARAALAKARAMDPAPMVLGWSGVAAAGAGTAEGRAEAREMLQQLERLSQTRYVSPFDRAVIHAALNEFDQAFFQLEKCYQERSVFMLYLPMEHHLENLRADPRFAVLWDKMKFNLPR